MQGDLTEDGMSDKIAEKCIEVYGSIDILVNGAGICKIADVLEFGRKEWDTMIAINLTGAFDLSRSVAKYMIPQKSGKIINICSLFSLLGGLGSPAYAAMKAGLMGLTKAYADELGKYGITVNGIAHGYFQTSMTSGTGSANDEKYIKIKEHVPADRWGERQDLMGAMVFMQIFADVFGIPAKRNVVNGAAGVGAAICAAVAVGAYKTFDEAIEKMVKVKDVFEPNKENVELYAKMCPIYNEITSHTDAILKKSYEIFK